MSAEGRILSVNLSGQKGTPKRPVPAAFIGSRGLEGDAHAGTGNRQVSILSAERIRRFAAETGRDFHPGEFAENLTVEGLDLSSAALLDRLSAGGAVLQVTQRGKSCHGERCAVFRAVGRCIMPTEGIFCRVLEPGPVRPGDPIVHHRRRLRGLVVTLSDRAHRGEYEDRSGPRVEEELGAFCRETGWQGEFRRVLLPDDAGKLRETLEAARREGLDLVVTTGSTGPGPRDVAPEVASAFCDRLIPGIMEAVRLKYGRENPRALLSRGIAGVAGRMLLYTLPGSQRAVSEYMVEIRKTLEHLLYLVNGLEVH